jgi:hypothetical protein
MRAQSICRLFSVARLCSVTVCEGALGVVAAHALRSTVCQCRVCRAFKFKFKYCCLPKRVTDTVRHGTVLSDHLKSSDNIVFKTSKHLGGFFWDQILRGLRKHFMDSHVAFEKLNKSEDHSKTIRSELKIPYAA